MSSIAYVTDKQMIEYHRLNGNRSMNFWRPGSQKKFANFSEGDLLFFLAKGSQRGKKREKGIVGYGKFKQANTLSFKQMWNRYGTLNGYATQNDLYEAILKVSKDKKMPKQMNCLFLEEVVFFQSPIYLSELGLSISNKVESYIYLDKEDQQATSKLLNKAKESGVDMWMQALSNEAESDTFEEDEIKHQFSLVFSKFEDSPYSATELRKAMKLAKEKCELSPFELIKGSKTDCIRYESDQITIAVPFLSKAKDFHLRKQYFMGHALGYVLYFKQLSDKNIKLKFEVISDGSAQTEIQEIVKEFEELLQSR